MSGNASINLGLGNLITNDQKSSMSGGSIVPALHYVGDNGSGTFTQTGGSNTPNGIYLGYNAGDSGTYVLSGGRLTATYGETVGYSGTGTSRSRARQSTP